MQKRSMSRNKSVMTSAFCGVMAALVFVTTMIIRIPVPATGGYIIVGDLMIFVSSLLFGPIIGGFAGGVGSALSDLIGFPSFVFYTLVIKGVEGLVAGKFGKSGKTWVSILGVIIAGIAMVAGYFVVEFYLFGLGAAVTELPGNIFQASFGAIVAVPLSLAIKKMLPTTFENLKNLIIG